MMDLTSHKVKVDIRYELEYDSILKLHRDDSTLSFIKKMRKVECIDGVTLHDTAISVHLSGSYKDVMHTVDKTKQIITEHFNEDNS